MTEQQLLSEIERIRQKPLVVVCQTPEGKRAAMTIQDCLKIGLPYLHIAADELDRLLDKELHRKQ